MRSIFFRKRGGNPYCGVWGVPRGGLGENRSLRVSAISALCVLCAFLLWAACAKKALPPSPDRFAPNLKEITIPNRTNIVLRFDEEVKGERFLLFSAKETLRVESFKAKGNQITLFTTPMKKDYYLLTGEVSDLLGNRRRLSLRFLGSEKRDTIRPEIKDIGFMKDRLEVIFSKPMDTANLRFFTRPIRPEGLQVSWSEERERLFLRQKDTAYLSYISFLLLPTLADREGNRLKRGIAFQKIFDTLLLAETLFTQKGSVILDEKGLEGAVIYIKSATTELSFFLLSDANGEFNVRLKSGGYEVQSFYDADCDGFIDFAATSELEVPSQPLLLKMAPVERKVAIYEYID